MPKTPSALIILDFGCSTRVSVGGIWLRVVASEGLQCPALGMVAVFVLALFKNKAAPPGSGRPPHPRTNSLAVRFRDASPVRTSRSLNAGRRPPARADEAPARLACLPSGITGRPYPDRARWAHTADPRACRGRGGPSTAPARFPWSRPFQPVELFPRPGARPGCLHDWPDCRRASRGVRIVIGPARRRDSRLSAADSLSRLSSNHSMLPAT